MRQKLRHLPGDDWYSITASAPASSSKYLRRTGAFVTNAPPCALRHVRQWQWATGPSFPWIAKRTAPQRQLPVSIGGYAFTNGIIDSG